MSEFEPHRHELHVTIVEYDSVRDLQRAIKQMGGKLHRVAGGYYRKRPNNRHEVHIRRIQGQWDFEGQRMLGHEIWHAMGGRH